MVMLGSSCSPCCGCPCPDGQTLPEAVTVTFNGLTKNATKVENLLGLEFSSCYGSGATGTVSAQGGQPHEGFPIEAVTLTNGGSGYAKLGRVAPTLTITGSGSGATFTPTFSISKDACGIPTWSIKSVTVSGGSGYQDGEQLTVKAATGDTEVEPASLSLQTQRQQPTLTASASGGTGASFSVSLSANGTTPETWGVASVSVTNGGTGYPAVGSISFSAGADGVAEQAAFAAFYSGRTAPTVTASVYGSGSGASLAPSLAAGTDWNGRSIWSVDGVTINDGGSGYAEWEYVTFTATDGDGYGGYGVISSVDENGGITGISLLGGGEYYKSTGVIESVEVDNWSRGAYYKSGPPSAVVVDAGGKFYREDPAEEPYVATVTVNVTQQYPSDGSGAQITATVESNTASPAFGTIKELTLDSGGSGYLSWSWTFSDCALASRLNGRSFLLKRTSPTSCSFSKCYQAAVLSVVYAGYGAPPKVTISGQCSIDFLVDAEEAPFACSPMSFVATEMLGGTATVASGDAESIQSCEDIYNASGISVEIDAEDYYTRYIVHPSIGCPDIAVSSGWPGSKYAGAFELSPDGESGGWKYFRYHYDDDPQMCSNPYIQLAIRTSDYAMVLQLVNHNTIARINRDGQTFTPLSDLTCSYSPTGSGCNSEYQVQCPGTSSASNLCLCEPESIDTSSWLAAACGFSSDSQQAAPTEILEETGSLSIRLVSMQAIP